LYDYGSAHRDGKLYYTEGREKGSPSSTFQSRAAGKAIDRENLPGNLIPPNTFWFPPCHMPTTGNTVV